MKVVKRLILVVTVFSLVFSLCFSGTAAEAVGGRERIRVNAYDFNEIYFINVPSDFAGISPEFNELLSLFVRYNFYELDYIQSIHAMLSSLMAQFPGIYHFLAHALLTAMDPYAGFFPAHDASYIFNTLSANEFYGFGMSLGSETYIRGRGFGVIINRVMPGSPAARAGLQANDAIVDLNGFRVAGLGMAAVSDVLSFIDDELIITVRRAGREHTFTLEREIVYRSPLILREIDDNTAYIQILNFLCDIMIDDFEDMLWDLYESGIERIIFDVRGNPGGSLETVLEMVNMLVTGEGQPLCTVLSRGGQKEVIYSTGSDLKFDEMVILTNGGSASASEYFAIALRELEDAVIIGTPTVGKAIGQSYHVLSNGDVAAITEIEILSPRGNRFHAERVFPDIMVFPREEFAVVNLNQIAPLNFVNCVTIRPGADNTAVRGLNERLAIMGYINPETVSSVYDEQTANAVRIFQTASGLPVGDEHINYSFVSRLILWVAFETNYFYTEIDMAFECALIFLNEGREAAQRFAES